MSTYEEEYPETEGPFGVGALAVKSTMDRMEPVISVSFDFGAFRRVWEIVEAEAKRHFPTRDTLSTARAELRAVDEFRTAWLKYAPVEVASSEVRPRRFKRSAREDEPGPEPEAPQRRKLNRRKA